MSPDSARAIAAQCPSTSLTSALQLMRILGIETSCDETGIAIYDDQLGLLGHSLHSQIEIHAAFGGVVPELASRDHIRRCLPMIDELMAQTQTRPEDLDAIAFTEGPGLIGALLVGASIARALGYAWDIPSIGIHHMEGHLLASELTDSPPPYPLVALLVSGGHTQLMASTSRVITNSSENRSTTPPVRPLIRPLKCWGLAILVVLRSRS